MCSLYEIYYIQSIRKCSNRAKYFKNILINAQNGVIAQIEKLKTSRKEKDNAQEYRGRTSEERAY